MIGGTLSVEQIGEYLRVSGYADGPDWWVPLPHGRPEFSYGTAGPGSVWYAERGGGLCILDTSRRRGRAIIELEGYSPTRVLTPPVTASRDGQRLYVLRWLGATDKDQGRVHVIDVSAGAEVAAHGPLPAHLGARPVERPDGRLLLPTLRQSLVLLDPSNGEWTESTVPGPPGGENFYSNGSPDGRYWIRFDAAALPVHETTPGFFERLRGEKKKTERRYGLTLQIWETFPLRLVGRIVAAWLTAKELPDETHLARSKSRPEALPSRRALWDAIAAARSADPPLDQPPPRSAYPTALASEDAAWDAVEKNLWRLKRWVEVVGWQPDGTAFWVTTNRFLSCIGVDGTVSPRLYSERLGLEGGTWLPVAARWRAIVPMAGRTARVIYNAGSARFDGTPRAHPHVPFAISSTRDDWHADDATAADRAAHEQLEVLREQRRRIEIPFDGWSEAACVAAIDALTNELNEDFPRRAASNEVRVVFVSRDGEVSEEHFFTEVGTRFGGATPAIRRLIDRYCDIARPGDYLFSRAIEGIGIFAWAAKTLGVLDRSALPTLKRYGVLMDHEHEHCFAGTIVPAVVAAHGWTDDVINFVFWVLVLDYYNTLDDYGKVWAGWGLRDALIQREPREFARHIAVELAETIQRKVDPGRYGTGGLDRLAKQIPHPHEPWAAAFFEELERIFSVSSAR
jgi:hypothetical protein